MRGVGGPLLCIGDLLSDVGDDRHDTTEEEEEAHQQQQRHLDPIAVSRDPSTLHQLFEYVMICEATVEMIEVKHAQTCKTYAHLCKLDKKAKPTVDLTRDNYNKLIESLEGNDHSWTALTLELCSALKTTNKLITCADSNIKALLEKVEVLENILKRGDSAVATAKAIKYAYNKGAR